ncbi:MAG: DUF167 domain-containing protein [Candidatus Aenigmarchaeota archaeon]|nr:DUF167 domain-containing protein [Candidatus Aenigmarchaeota archaeon]
MKLNIRTVPNASENKIVKEEGRLKAYLNAPAFDDKANKMLIEVLAEHLGVRKTDIAILSGHKSKNKVIEVSE